MKYAAILLLALLASAGANAKGKKTKQKSKMNFNITSVRMERTGCYGKCPSYVIEVSNNCMATYTGKRYTEDSGTFEKNIGCNRAAEIMNKVNTNRLDTCKDEYPMKNVDFPGLIITINYKSHTKTINNASYGPMVLKELETAIDGIAGQKLDNTWHRKALPKNK